MADFTENILYSSFKTPYKNIESIHEKLCVEQKNEGRKQDKNLSLRRLVFMPRNLD